MSRPMLYKAAMDLGVSQKCHGHIKDDDHFQLVVTFDIQRPVLERSQHPWRLPEDNPVPCAPQENNLKFVHHEAEKTPNWLVNFRDQDTPRKSTTNSLTISSLGLDH
jgi:hypothetical protein